VSLSRLIVLAVQTLLLVWLSVPASAQARGSWLFDPAELHRSAHGNKMTCAKCHDDIADSDLHPDPANVGRLYSSAALEEKCRKCHDRVYEDLAESRHGRMKTIQPVRFEDCLSCHDPHSSLKREYYRLGLVDSDGAPREQCGSCHEVRQDLPKHSSEDEECLECHAFEADAPASQELLAAVCFHCHGNEETETQRIAGRDAVLIDEAEYKDTPHANQLCTACHPAAAAYGHADQAPGDCTACHSSGGALAGAVGPTGNPAPAAPHYAEMPEDPHLNVECQACHLGGGQPVPDAVTRRVVWESKAEPGGVSTAHAMTRAEETEDCQVCHVQNNELGAVAMVLPAKSVLCIGCHTASPTGTDTTTILSLLVFGFGVFVMFAYWLSGTIPGREEAGPLAKLGVLALGVLRTVASARILVVLKTLIVEVIFQKRLLKQYPSRWVIHSLIFLPFVFRFAWGLAGLVCSNLWQGATWYEFLIDKNHPATALLFDLTGIMVIVGVCAAVIRGVRQSSERVPGLPLQDHLALGLIGGVIVVGFLLEGMRIAMTEPAAGAAWAFFGYAISLAFTSGPALASTYGYVWYLHAILTGAFVAYLPFSRMFHILLAPVILTVNAVRQAEHHHGHAEGEMAPQRAAGD